MSPVGPSAPSGSRAGGGAPPSLSGREPRVDAARLVAALTPPPRFAEVRFATYVPDPGRPGQEAAVRLLEDFARAIGETPERGRGRRLLGARSRRAPAPAPARGIYVDGGYGVGKTHLLASLWHAAPVEPARKAFCTFVELTHLVGALGFQRAVEALSGHRLLCVDEFELDDPGDTVLISSFLGRLADAGVALAATSNTLPDRLGEGRFAAADFLREIQGLAARFHAVRVDGDDHRHRGLPPAPAPYDDAVVEAAARRVPGAFLDRFPELLAHLARVHPSRYGALAEGVGAVCLTGVAPVRDQAVALRLVVLADRLYDRELPVLASGVPFDALFGEELLRGAYRKKYYRALSRLTALAREGARLLDAAPARDTAPGTTSGEAPGC
ncbi:cell division protein ZapE [Streptomyces sp. NPDC050560]|uniref:cell division protein ZapE n=1 Tax=Streptomyces sp. NPDC050560 TaxID=3365630 RepID=UPI00378E2217